MFDDENIPCGVSVCDVTDANDVSYMSDDFPKVDTFDCIVDASVKLNV